MKVIVSSPSIAPHVKQTVMAYHEAGVLKKFYCSFFEHPKNSISNFLSRIIPLRELISRRKFHELPIENFEARQLPELIRSFAARKASPLLTDKIWEWSELGFDKWVSSSLKNDIDVVHTYEHAALATLKQAKKLGIFSVYEQPSQHHHFFTQIVEEQFLRYPALRTDNTALLINEKAIRRNKRRDEELNLASMVICNSTFTKKTLIAGGVSENKILVIPLGFPPVISRTNLPKSAQEPVTFIYAGNQSIRKGSHLLYEAWRKCNFSKDEARLLLVGKMTLPESLRADLPGEVIIKENIPHEKLMELLAQADVFVLPTLADGFAMVVTESMANGLPVIASENCCGPDVITPMKDGWIIPAGKAEPLIDQLKWCVANKANLASFGINAQLKAAKYQWETYRTNLVFTISTSWKNQQKGN